MKVSRRYSELVEFTFTILFVFLAVAFYIMVRGTVKSFLSWRTALLTTSGIAVMVFGVKLNSASPNLSMAVLMFGIVIWSLGIVLSDPI